MIKIGLNTTALLSPKSGIGQYVQQLSTRLLQMPSLEIKFFCGLRWGNVPQPSADIAKTFERYTTLNSWANQFPSVRRASLSLKNSLQQIAFSRGVKRQSIDLYHEPNFISFEHDRPTVITVHDMSPFRLAQHHKKDLVELFQKRLPAAIDHASAIIVDSQFVKDEVIAYFPNAAEKVFPVHLAAGNEFREYAHDECVCSLEQYGLTFKRYLLAVGTLEPRKNLVSAIRAYLRLPQLIRRDYPLVIAGMKGWHHDDFEAEAEALIRLGQIRMLGYVSDEVLPKLYSGASLLLYPSIYEGFGLPPLEAMACGTPVITSNVASLPEVVGSAAIAVAPHDIDALTRGIESVLMDHEAAASLRLKGLEQAADFSWEKTAAETVAVYKRVIGR